MHACTFSSTKISTYSANCQLMGDFSPSSRHVCARASMGICCTTFSLLWTKQTNAYFSYQYRSSLSWLRASMSVKTTQMKVISCKISKQFSLAYQLLCSVLYRAFVYIFQRLPVIFKRNYSHLFIRGSYFFILTSIQN